MVDVGEERSLGAVNLRQRLGALAFLLKGLDFADGIADLVGDDAVEGAEFFA